MLCELLHKLCFLRATVTLRVASGRFCTRTWTPSNTHAAGKVLQWMLVVMDRDKAVYSCTAGESCWRSVTLDSAFRFRLEGQKSQLHVITDTLDDNSEPCQYHVPFRGTVSVANRDVDVVVDGIVHDEVVPDAKYTTEGYGNYSTSYRVIHQQATLLCLDRTCTSMPQSWLRFIASSGKSAVPC